MARFRSLLGDAAALVLLWALVVAVTWRIALAGRVLAGGDVFTYFYPYWSEATRAIRDARLPLWNPYLFMGVPFAANSQVGLFYPLNWPLWLALDASQSVHLTIVLHLCLAALNAYVWGRQSLALGRPAGWTVAAVFALGGYLGAQIEHINQLQGLAWLPLMLVLHNEAASRRSETRRGALALAGLGTVIGLVLLTGHTQTAFISLGGLAVYGLGPALWLAVRRGHRRPLARGTALLAIAVGIGAMLAAVQLLPTLELSQQSVRSQGLPFNERVSFSLSPLYLGRALLPWFGGSIPPDHFEHVAYVGTTGLALAMVGLAAWVRGHQEKQSGHQPQCGFADLSVFLLTLIGLSFALGAFNPLYLLLARCVPGFAHFRVPARWLALYALGAAALAGRGVQAVWEHRQIGGRTALAVAASLSLLLVWTGAGAHLEQANAPGLRSVVAWAGVILLAAGMLVVAARAPRTATIGLLILLITELTLASAALPHARATASQAIESLRPAAAHLMVSEPPDARPAGRFLSMSDTNFDPGDLSLIESIYGPQLSPDQLYEYVVSTKQKEILSPNLSLALSIPAADGYGGGVLPLQRYVMLQRLFLSAEDVSVDGRLRENLDVVPDGRWLSLFNVRHVITDKLRDAWIDHIFYDLQFGATLSEGEEGAVPHVPPFEATTLGLVSHFEGDVLPKGTPVGEVWLGFADGGARTFELRAGEQAVVGHTEPEVEKTSATRLRWTEPRQPVSVTVRATLRQGRWVVRGMSLIDERTGSFQSLVLSNRGRFRLAHSGDVKIYENLDVLPRAFVVHRAQVAQDDGRALRVMRDPTFEPAVEAVLAGAAPGCGGTSLESVAGVGQGADGDTGGTGGATITEYQPERVVIEAKLDQPGYLLITDAWYPGWRASVDGETASLCRADLLFRAVALGRGEHRVVLAFRPAGQRLGVVVGGLGLAALAVMAGAALCGSTFSPLFCGRSRAVRDGSHMD
ncbi:MAG: YfhO family protein [Anaerolineae bacterium]|jgi:hypothetical protein